MQFVSIQYLRALAAAMVLALHVVAQGQRLGWHVGTPGWLEGGVDIFFVISGFIMWTTTAARPVTVLDFWRRRAARIVPLYWLLTACVVAAMLAAPGAVQSSRYDGWHVLASFAFLPSVNPVSGFFEPVLIPGWTLNYETFFYVVFGVALWLPARPRFAAVAVLFGALFALQPVARQWSGAWPFYTSGLLLEFVFGMALGAWRAHGARYVSRGAGALLVVGGLAAIALLWPVSSAATRALTIGLPAAAIVAGALALERAGALPRLPWLRRIGDASYSLYLVHPLVLSAGGQVWRHLGLAALPGAPLWFAAAMTAAVLAVSFGVYHGIEQPLARRLHRRAAPLTRAEPGGP